VRTRVGDRRYFDLKEKIKKIWVQQ